MVRLELYAQASRFFASLVLALLAVLPTVAFAQAIVTPKIVLQTLPITGIDVAAWTPDDRYIVSASGTDRDFIIWDVENRVILDRLRLPSGGTGAGAEMMRLTSIEVSPDGRSATVTGAITNLNQGVASVGRTYVVDLLARTVRITPAPAPADSKSSIEDFQRWLLALSVFYDANTGMSRAEAEQLLPQLPTSHNGLYTLRRNSVAFDIVASDGSVLPLKPRDAPLGIDGAALAPDGRRIAIVHLDDGKTGRDFTKIDVFDTLTARYAPQVTLKGDFEGVRWLNDTQFVAFAGTPTDDLGDATEEGQDVPPPVAIVDGVNGRLIANVPPRCYVTPLPGGDLIGAGVASCRSRAGSDRELARFDAASGTWRPLSQFKLDPGERISLIAASPAGDRLAVASVLQNGETAISLVDASSGAILNMITTAAGGLMTLIRFSPDGKTLFLAGQGHLAQWPVSAREFSQLPGQALLPTMFASDGRNLLVAGPLEDSINRLDLVSGSELSPLDLGNVMDGGFLPGKPIFWTATAMNGLTLWDTRTWTRMLTTYFFQDQHFIAVTPEGRYDTNLGPDASQFRWLVSDAKFQSLAPQTFMRDYFEPRLSQKLIDCRAANSCATAMKPLPPIADLNRVLPTVRITEVVPGDTAGKVIVSINVKDEENAQAPNGKTRSGVYGMKLFLNNRHVAQVPDNAYEPVKQTILEWRKANNSASNRGYDDVHRWEQTVMIPTSAETGRQVFSAYSFNEDRVKSDTATFTYVRPTVSPRPRRAFVLTIGIDAYDEQRLELNYAVADARLIAERLASIPGYDMRRVTLAGAKRPDGSVQPVTREIINTALGILAGFPPAQSIAELRNAGIDASALDNATPDDIVIISYSGHGWADKQGNFFLVPSDGKWATGDSLPDIGSLISSADLTMWLRAIAAGEIAFIIDACHSGASVDAGEFKPGPMGDAGLGQLAFDKGIRILAATQADDVALESANLKQGLLTAALGEGMTDSGGPADLNGDGKIVLDEWLRYAVKRLPSLSVAMRGSGAGSAPAGSRGFTFSNRAPVAQAKVQEPALFDFNNEPSKIVLRGKP
jgi:WD40 repeat protein